MQPQKGWPRLITPFRPVSNTKKRSVPHRRFDHRRPPTPLFICGKKTLRHGNGIYSRRNHLSHRKLETTSGGRGRLFFSLESRKGECAARGQREFPYEDNNTSSNSNSNHSNPRSTATARALCGDVRWAIQRTDENTCACNTDPACLPSAVGEMVQWRHIHSRERKKSPAALNLDGWTDLLGLNTHNRRTEAVCAFFHVSVDRANRLRKTRQS